MYDFFTLYASVDGWEWDGKLEDPYQELQHPLDQWIVSRVHQLTAEVTEHMDKYDLPNALKGVLPFIDDASNWYIRRSRKRFWKSTNDKDKELAYKTLHYVLVRLSLILAPFTPFMAEELYRDLTGGESVHLCDWPPAGQTNGIILNEMSVIRDMITQGLAERAEAGVRVRQPLQSVTVFTELDIKPELTEIIAEELNVKQVDVKADKESGVMAKLNLNITPKLKREGLARELIRHIQTTRKKADLNVDDRITLKLESDSEEVMKAFKEFKDEIYRETLTTAKLDGEGHKETLELEGAKVSVELKSN
jgi:isoleucyl-tRNA synthetase